MKTMKLWMTLCFFVMSVLPADAAVTREPYLQNVTPTSISIVWQTDLNSGSDSRVQYGTGAGNLNLTALGSAFIPPSNTSVRIHVVTINTLSPNTTYFYNVGTVSDGVQAGGTSNHFFVTAPSVATAMPFTAWVVGDSGDASGDQIAVMNAMLSVTGPTPPDLFLHLGDIAYNDGTDAEFTNNHFGIYRDILRQTPSWPTLGNHDAVNANSNLGTGPYYEGHVLPTVSSGTEAYYSFDYANAHFIVLDSMDSNRASGSAMLNWLQADLAGTTQEWVIAYWHHAPYTKGTHDSDNAADSGGRLVDMRENVLPLLEAGGVDLVLGGHSHLYERSFFIDQAYGYGSSPNFVTPNFSTLQSNGNILNAGDGDPTGDGAYEKELGGGPNKGTVYVVAGHGGRSVGSPFGGNHPVMFFTEVQFGSVLLDINGPTLKVRNVRSTGSITDTFSINKTSDGQIIWRNTSTGDTAAWLVNGLTLGSSGFPGGVPTEWIIADVGDLDGDDKADFVWWNMSTGDTAVWLMNGTTVSSTGFPGGAAIGWTIAGVGDVDGDGKADLVWHNASTGDTAVWLMNGTTVSSTGFPGGAAAGWTIAGVGDVDGDGKADFVWRNTSTGDTAVWLMNGTTVSSTGFPGGVSTEWLIAGVGDLDGDGKADLVWRNTSTGDVAVWLMNGLTVGSTGFPGGVSTVWTIGDVRDLDGDGKADLVWRNTSTGDVVGWLMNGATLVSSGTIASSVPLEWQVRP